MKSSLLCGIMGEKHSFWQSERFGSVNHPWSQLDRIIEVPLNNYFCEYFGLANRVTPDGPWRSTFYLAGYQGYGQYWVQSSGTVMRW